MPPITTAIRHIPLGYHPGDDVLYDRTPRVPREGERILIRSEVRSDLAAGGVYLDYAINGYPARMAGRLVRDYHAAPPVKYYLFELGPFTRGDRVEYTIRAGEDEWSLGPFRFTVNGLYTPGTAAIHAVEGGAEAVFAARDPYRPRLGLSLADGRLHLVLSLDDTPATGRLEAGTSELTLTDERTGIRAVLSGSPFHFMVFDRQDVPLFAWGKDFFTWIGTPAGEAHSFKLVLQSMACHYWGFGERFDALDQNGLTPEVCVVNQYTRQGDRTYLPVPFFLTERGYGLHVASDRYVRYRLRPSLPGTMSLEAQVEPARPRLELVFHFGSPAEIVRSFTASTGRAKLPPKWAFGPWMSSNPWNTQREIEEQLTTAERLGIPATVLVIEAWSDEATFYIWNDAVYQAKPGGEAFGLPEFFFPPEGRWPDPARLVEKAHQQGLRFILWQIPVLKHFPAPENEQHRLDEEHAVARGYCVKNTDGTPYRIPSGWFAGSLLLDFTNPEARAWWFAKRRYLQDELGVDGFKTDGGEFVLDETVRFHDGRDGAAMRNPYPLAYIGAYHDFMGEDRVTFSRAGFTGGQMYPLYWAGDQVSSYDEFRAVLTAGLSLSLSGNPFWGFDIGGFAGDVPTADLYIRATQMAAFSPVMQFHAESRGEENYDRTPWNMAARTGDERVIDIYRFYANLRMNLLPYIYNEARYAAAAGEPLMRALPIDFPDDPVACGIDDEYMFGRDLLVAPVLAENSRQRRLYLPPGEWLDFWTLREVSSGWHERYPCGLETIPVFIRKGAILPLNLGSSFTLGQPTGVKGTVHARRCFLLTGELISSWEYDNGEGYCVRFVAEKRGLQIEMSAGRSADVFLLSQEKMGELEVVADSGWGGRHPGLWVYRVKGV